MNPASAKTMMWSSAILILVGFALGSPSGALFALALAAFCALLGLIFGARWVRVVSGLLLLVALAYGAFFFQAFRKDQADYRRHATERAKAPPSPSP